MRKKTSLLNQEWIITTETSRSLLSSFYLGNLRTSFWYISSSLHTDIISLKHKKGFPVLSVSSGPTWREQKCRSQRWLRDQPRSCRSLKRNSTSLYRDFFSKQCFPTQCCGQTLHRISSRCQAWHSPSSIALILHLLPVNRIHSS